MVFDGGNRCSEADRGPGVSAGDQPIQIHMNTENGQQKNKVKELSLWMDKQRRKKERAERSGSLGGVRSLTEERQVGGQQLSSGGGGAALANVYLLAKCDMSQSIRHSLAQMRYHNYHKRGKMAFH